LQQFSVELFVALAYLFHPKIRPHESFRVAAKTGAHGRIPQEAFDGIGEGFVVVGCN